MSNDASSVDDRKRQQKHHREVQEGTAGRVHSCSNGHGSGDHGSGGAEETPGASVTQRLKQRGRQEPQQVQQEVQQEVQQGSAQQDQCQEQEPAPAGHRAKMSPAQHVGRESSTESHTTVNSISPLATIYVLVVQ